ncbi:hypothetical protein J6590_009755 [Homalodisca vitripennis]|nr:hypothetical protein J6590_009755 [Homalodisca vitripennis]
MTRGMTQTEHRNRPHGRNKGSGSVANNFSIPINNVANTEKRLTTLSTICIARLHRRGNGIPSDGDMFYDSIAHLKKRLQQ